MDAKVYCNKVRDYIIIKNITPHERLPIEDFPCFRKDQKKDCVHCILDNERCFPYSDVATEILNMPRETTGDSRTITSADCPGWED